MSDQQSDPGGEVRGALEMLLGADLARCGFGDLDVLRGACQRVRGFVSAVDVGIARRSRELCDQPPPGGGGPSPGGGDGNGDGNGDGADAGDGGGDGGAGGDGDGDGDGGGGGGGFGGDRRSEAEIERDHQRARLFAVMPLFETALSEGRLDVAHVDAVVAALARVDVDEVRREFVACERELLGYAGVERPDRFRRRCHDLVRRLLRAHGIEVAARQKKAANARHWWDRRTGMFHLKLEVEPELGAKIETAIDDHLAAVRDRGTADTWQRCRVDAVAELITHSGALEPRAPEVVVLVDWDSLRTGVLSPGGVCESHGGGELAPDTVRRLACDAGVMPLVLGGDGIPLDAGRTRRLATREQRRALRAMYRTCAHPECDRPFSWCRIHHIVFWERLGVTDLANMIPLCDRHHHLVHEGGWTLTMTPDRMCTWTTPSGRVWFHGDTRDALGPDHPCSARPAGQADGRAGQADGGAGRSADGAGSTGGDRNLFGGGGSHGPPAHDRPYDGRNGRNDATGHHDVDDVDDREPDGAELVGSGATRRAHRRSGSAHDADHTDTLFDHDIERAGP